MIERERMESFRITNATVVLPDVQLDGGAIVVADGRIADIAPSAAGLRRTADREIDAEGAYLLPGVVDLHNDGYEYEMNPRPGANLPLPLAFSTFERRLVAAGVTTEFHAISFMDRPATGRSVSAAERAAEYIAELRRGGFRAVDHQILHRLDVWSPSVLDMVFTSVDQMPVRYLSLNDHTPGQGQFRDIDGYIARMKAYELTRGTSPLDVDGMLQTIAKRAADTETLPAILTRLQAEAARTPLVIATHDDDSAQKTEFGYGLGARVGEFPVTVGAARRQRELGMPIIVGAPNIVRGGPHDLDRGDGAHRARGARAAHPRSRRRGHRARPRARPRRRVRQHPPPRRPRRRRARACRSRELQVSAHGTRRARHRSRGVPPRRRAL